MFRRSRNRAENNSDNNTSRPKQYKLYISSKLRRKLVWREFRSVWFVETLHERLYDVPIRVMTISFLFGIRF